MRMFGDGLDVPQKVVAELPPILLVVRVMVWVGMVSLVVFLVVPSVAVRYDFAWMIDEDGNLGTVR